jgi:hypothetical protein
MEMTVAIYSRRRRDSEMLRGRRTDAWAMLRALGFSEDRRVISDLYPGLSFDFGNLKLSAGSMLNGRFVPVVLLSGLISTKRNIASIEAELPLEVESIEQGMAFVAWSLDNAAHGRFEPAITPAWLETGRTHRHLLPWERERAEADARPHCSVHRDWMRVALKKLAATLDAVSDGEPVRFAFDGSTLTVRCADSFMAMPAHGYPWTLSYSISAGALKPLAKRLMSKMIEISVWKSTLTRGNRRYTEVIAVR